MMYEIAIWNLNAKTQYRIIMYYVGQLFSLFTFIWDMGHIAMM